MSSSGGAWRHGVFGLMMVLFIIGVGGVMPWLKEKLETRPGPQTIEVFYTDGEPADGAEVVFLDHDGRAVKEMKADSQGRVEVPDSLYRDEAWVEIRLRAKRYGFEQRAVVTRERAEWPLQIHLEGY